MASSYEKAACGAEPGGSWVNARPADNVFSGAVAILLFALMWGPTFWWLASMAIRHLAG